MLQDLLLPSAPDLRLDSINLGSDMISLTVTATAPQVQCRQCAQVTTAIHSHYTRCVTDLSVVGLPLQMHLHVRKFFCHNPRCSRKVFAERLTPFIQVYARRTTRLRQTLEQVGLDLGGEGGARLSTKQGIGVSHDTLLRWVRAIPEPEVKTPRVLGVDDWARRKGQTYGTILVDLETHQPIELLPDREADTLATWLQHHPGIEIITRDRAGAFAEGAQQGAPTARQVADRFHLLQNLRDTAQRFMDRHQSLLRQVVAGPAEEAVTEPTESSEKSALPGDLPSKQPDPALTRRELRRQESRSRRQNRYSDVQRLKQEGLSVRAIARQPKMSRHTVGRFLTTDTFPERAHPPRKTSILDPFVPYLTEQMSAGQSNGMQLWREICAKGYKGSRPLVSRWVAQHRHLALMNSVGEPKRKIRGRPPRAKPTMHGAPIPPLSARQAAWLVVRHPNNLDDEQRKTLERLRELSDDVQALYPLAQEFAQMVRTRNAQSLDPWLQRARESKVREIVSFANSLDRDRLAVLAGLELPYSNGQVEGQVNRLKLIKRSMYGRGNLDLLRKRVLLQ